MSDICKCRYPKDKYNGTGRCLLCNNKITTSLKLDIKVPNINKLVGVLKEFHHLGEISKTYLSFDDYYKLITETNNVEICKFCLDSDGVWKRLELQWMLEHFQKNEDYEKCVVLKELMDKHFIGDESKQNELNVNKIKNDKGEES
jgi:hypothetical protein